MRVSRKLVSRAVLPAIFLASVGCGSTPPPPEDPGSQMFQTSGPLEGGEDATFARLEHRLKRHFVEVTLDHMLDPGERKRHGDGLEKSVLASCDSYISKETVIEREPKDGDLEIRLRLSIDKDALERDVDHERESPSWLQVELAEADACLLQGSPELAASIYERAHELAAASPEDRIHTDLGFVRARVRSLVLALSGKLQGAKVVVYPIALNPGVREDLDALVEEEVRSALLAGGAVFVQAALQDQAAFLVSWTPLAESISVEVTTVPDGKLASQVKVSALGPEVTFPWSASSTPDINTGDVQTGYLGGTRRAETLLPGHPFTLVLCWSLPTPREPFEHAFVIDEKGPATPIDRRCINNDFADNSIGPNPPHQESRIDPQRTPTELAVIVSPAPLPDVTALSNLLTQGDEASREKATASLQALLATRASSKGGGAFVKEISFEKK